MRLAALLLLLLAASLPHAEAAPRYTALYAFGDSLTDVGNDWIASGHQFPVSPPYNNGRFSNGPVWVEDVAEKLGLKPLAPSLSGGTDFAYGGGRTANPNGKPGAAPLSVFPQNLPGQVALFEASVGGHAPPEALYAVWSGGFDLLAQGGKGGPAPDLTTVAETAAANVGTAVDRLLALGAKHILVANLPDLTRVPGGARQPPAVAGARRAAVLAYNRVLAETLAGKPGVVLVDMFTPTERALASPAASGFTDIATPCWTGNNREPGSGRVCAETRAGQDGHMFWDKVHPGAKLHALFAEAALARLP